MGCLVILQKEIKIGLYLSKTEIGVFRAEAGLSSEDCAHAMCHFGKLENYESFRCSERITLFAFTITLIAFPMK